MRLRPVLLLVYHEASRFKQLWRGDDAAQQRMFDQAREGSATAHDGLLAMQTRWMLAWFERELPACLRSKFDADDLVQDVCLDAWKGFESFKGESIAEYRKWLAKACLHCLLDRLAEYATASRELSREVPLDVERIANGNQRPFHRRWSGDPDGISAVEAAEEVERLLAVLPARARQVVALYVFEERTFCESADELGCCARTVRRDWERALAELRRRGPPSEA